MKKDNCINHVRDTYMAILREDYFILCEKNHCSAMILNQFENWMNVKIASKTKADCESMIAQKSELTPTQNNGLWVWKTQEQLKEELYNLFGINRIRDSLVYLVKKEYLLRRRNPKYNWDKTYQYMINVNKVQRELNKIAKQLKDKTEELVEQELLDTEDSVANVKNSNIEYSDLTTRSFELGDSKLSNHDNLSVEINESSTPISSCNTIDNYIDDNDIDNKYIENVIEVSNPSNLDDPDLFISPVKKENLQILKSIFEDSYRKKYQQDYEFKGRDETSILIVMSIKSFEISKDIILCMFENWEEISKDNSISGLPTVEKYELLAGIIYLNYFVYS